MTLTREHFKKMKEAQLQTQVLMLLFKEMGYKDITLYQGSDELGKDIVMWKPGDLGERVNYAVVAKAKKIDGKAIGNSSAANVRFQLEQALTNPYLDPITGTTQHIDRCFVVSNKEITTTAMKAVIGVLQSQNINKITRFINGDELWKLYEEFLSERAVWAKLDEVKRVLDNADPHYRMVGRITADSISLSPEPKDAKSAEDHPISLSGRFKFPDTPEGRAKKEEVDRYLKTGSKLELTKEFFELVDLPDFMKRFLGPILDNDYKFTSGTLPTLDNVVIVKIEFVCDDGEVVSFDYIPLLKVQGGSEEVTLTNENQKVPWKFKLIHNFETAETQVKFTLQYDDVNVKRVLEGFQFGAAIAKGGTFRVEHWESGFTMSNGHIKQGTFPTPEPGWMYMLERLLFIQNKLMIPFAIPKEGISFEEAKPIFETAHILEFGRVEADSITLNVEQDFAKEILEWFESGKPYFSRMERPDEIAEILNNQIPLGPVRVTILNGYLSKKDLAVLRNAIKTAAPEDAIPVFFKSSKDRQIIVEYPNWLPVEQTVATNETPTQDAPKTPKKRSSRRKPQRRR